MIYEKPNMDVIELKNMDVIRTSMEDGDWEDEDQGTLNTTRSNMYNY